MFHFTLLEFNLLDLDVDADNCLSFNDPSETSVTKAFQFCLVLLSQEILYTTAGVAWQRLLLFHQVCMRLFCPALSLSSSLAPS